MRAVLVVIVAAVGVGAFFAGRGSVDRARPAPARGSFAAGVLAGREAAFAGFDGGWSYGAPYVVTLRRGGTGITYRFASRRPLLAGRSYRRCGSSVCISR